MAVKVSEAPVVSIYDIKLLMEPVFSSITLVPTYQTTRRHSSVKTSNIFLSMFTREHVLGPMEALCVDLWVEETADVTISWAIGTNRAAISGNHLASYRYGQRASRSMVLPISFKLRRQGAICTYVNIPQGWTWLDGEREIGGHTKPRIGTSVSGMVLIQNLSNVH